MKLIIAGSRTFDNYELLCEMADRVHSNVDEVTEVVCGGAKGADSLGKRWADEHEIPVKLMPAKWSEGKAAGPARNAAMADYGDNLLAFWDGISPGTKNMIQLMKIAEKPYKVINYGGDQ
jgi:hypothetical protein